MKIHTALILAVALPPLLAACSVQKPAIPMTGSRSDGTVEMVVEWGAFQTPQTNWEQARMEAAKKCQVWGYNNAEAFGGERRQCMLMTGDGICATWRATVTYQCTTDKKPAVL